MRLEFDDTIAALASAPGHAARGIVRLSGNDTIAVLCPLFRAETAGDLHAIRRPTRIPGQFRLDSSGLELPAALYLWPTGRSYTGQPLAELHCVGSPPLLEVMLSRLYAAGVRPARPGEFTLRAFLAGRIDLVQAEAVLGVIDADDHEELEAALQQLAGGVSGWLTDIRLEVITILGDLEAGLDFVEEDIEFISATEIVQRIDVCQAGIERLLAQAESRMHSAVQSRVVLAGLPNAGKSTLYNALIGNDRSLVSSAPGTTRDYLEETIDCDGRCVRLSDTAGWEAGRSAIDEEAQRLRSRQLDNADLVVWCAATDLDGAEIDNDSMRYADACERGRPILRVRTKCDLPHGIDKAPGDAALAVSVPAGTGLSQLKAAITAMLSRTHVGERQLLGSTSARCHDSLSNASACLGRARQAVQQRMGDELVSIELRETLDRIGRILGDVYTDDILDHIFNRFCIGK